MRHSAQSDAEANLQPPTSIVATNIAPNPKRVSPDITSTQHFINILAGKDEITFQAFRDLLKLKSLRQGGTKYKAVAKYLHGTLNEYASELERLNEAGAGIFLMINQGDGRGRRTENVRCVRALFIDMDGAPLPTEWRLKPHLKLQTSPGKYHVYWRVEGIELADFSTIQKGLAEIYGSDPNVHDLPRVMRLPGFYHQKYEPIQVQLLEANDHLPYTPTDIFTAWPRLAERLEVRKVEKAKQESERAEPAIRAARRHHVAPISATKAQQLLQSHFDTVAAAKEGTRHEVLKNSAYTLGGYVGGGNLDTFEADEMLQAAAKVCGLPAAEAAGVIRWGLEKGFERPLEFTADAPQRRRVKPSFGAKEPTLNVLRPTQAKSGLMQEDSHRTFTTLKPSFGGRRCR